MSHTGRLPNGATPSRPNTPTTPQSESGEISPRTVEAESPPSPPTNKGNGGGDSLPRDRSSCSLGLFRRRGFARHNPWALSCKPNPHWCDSISSPVPKAMLLPFMSSQRDKPETSPMDDTYVPRRPPHGPIGYEIMPRRNAMAGLLPSPLPRDEIHDKPGLHAELGHWDMLFRLQMWSPIASMMGMDWEEVEELAWHVGKEELCQLVPSSSQAL